MANDLQSTLNRTALDRAIAAINAATTIEARLEALALFISDKASEVAANVEDSLASKGSAASALASKLAADQALTSAVAAAATASEKATSAQSSATVATAKLAALLAAGGGSGGSVSIANVAGLAEALNAKAAPADISAAILALTKNSVGLANVANIAPADLPLSTATSAAISSAMAAIRNGADADHDTLGEIQALLAADESVIASLLTAVGARLITANNLSEIASAGAVAQKAARANLGGAKRFTYGDVNQTIDASARIVALTTALTSSRTWTLPLASALNGGERFRFVDEVGGLSQAATLTLARSGADTINGGVSQTFAAAFSGIDLVSDGVSKWTFDVVGLGRGGTGAASAAAARVNLGVLAADFFGYVPGNWYIPFGVDAYGTGGSQVVGRMHFAPTFIPEKCALSALGLRVTTAAAGLCQIAIYAADPSTKRPTGLPLVISPSMSTANAAAISASISKILDPGLYWTAIVSDNAAVVYVGIAQLSSWTQRVIGSSNEANIASSATTALQFFRSGGAIDAWPDMTGQALSESGSTAQNLVPLVRMKMGSLT